MPRNALEIRAGGAVIRGCPTDLSRPWGIFVKPKGFQGWEGIATRRREQVARAVEHGEHDVPVLLGSRVVTIDGWIIAPNERELRAFAHQINGIGADGEKLTVTVDLQGQTLHAAGRVVSAWTEDEGERIGWYVRASFQIQLVFADPRRYGVVERFPATGYATQNDAYQRGNFPAHPVVEFGSGPASFTCTAPGGRSAQVSGLTAGGTVRYDMRTGRITRNGVDVTDTATIQGDLWAVPVGATWRHTLNVPGRILLPETFI